VSAAAPAKPRARRRKRHLRAVPPPACVGPVSPDDARWPLYMWLFERTPEQHKAMLEPRCHSAHLIEGVEAVLRVLDEFAPTVRAACVLRVVTHALAYAGGTPAMRRCELGLTSKGGTSRETSELVRELFRW